jgi:hypothetical protein
MFGMPQFRKLVDSYDYRSTVAIARLSAGEPISPALSDLERLAMAVSATRPSHGLDINSRLERDAFMRGFAKLKQRIASERRPLVYVGVVARGKGDAGYHGHFLLWTSLHYNTIHKHLRELGLGRGLVKVIDYKRPEVVPALRVAAYVFGQEEAVFRSVQHEHHRARPKSARRFLHPQRETLRRLKPELLTALDLAKDPTLSDVALFQRCLTLLEDK